MAEQSNEIAPWKQEWGRGASSPPPQDLTAQPDTGLPPWQKEWGRLPAYDRETANQASGEALQGTIDCDSVFEKLIQAESRGRHRDRSGRLTTSPVGAQGITQVMPKTGQDPGYGVTPLRDNSEEEFRRFGRDYLRAMLKEFNGDYRKAVAAYNAGPGNVKKAIRKAELPGEDWTQYIPKRSETLPYMERILGENSG